MPKSQSVKPTRSSAPKQRTPAKANAAPALTTPDKTTEQLAQAPQTLSPAELLQLQRTLGNRALSQALPGVQRFTAAHTTGCACPACSTSADTATPAVQRVAAHATGCACPTCSGSAQTPTVQREAAHDQGCSCSACSAPELVQAKREPAWDEAALQMAVSHATHTHEATPATRAQRKAFASAGQFHLHPANTHPAVIQRHSSWEHQLLGDVPPKQLAEIGTWQDLINQTKREKDGPHFWSSKLPNQEEAEVEVKGVGKIKKGQVMHVLAQEMQRLSDWQQNPPKSRKDQEFLSKFKDPQWGVLLVALPSTGGKPPLIITYGEMNTLADFYSNLETMKNANPEHREQIVQSVRQETFFRLKDIYQQLVSSLTDTEKQDGEVQTAQGIIKDNGVFDQKRVGYKFKGAMTPDYVSGLKGQLELLQGVQKTGAQGKTNEYGATLARNACHFVPESWHAWAKYHEDARTHALLAFQARQAANKLKYAFTQTDYSRRPLDQAEAQTQIKLKEAEAEREENEALMNNGFGDHYLQDSYASGHMINKTQVMQWYVEWIDKTGEWDYFKDKNWRKVQQMAYKQPGLTAGTQYDKKKVKGYKKGATGAQVNQPHNPQSVEDIQDQDWLVRFKALGLQVPQSLQTPGSPERQLVEWWQQLAHHGYRELTGGLLANHGPLKTNHTQLRITLGKLLDDGIIRVDGMSVEERGAWMRGVGQVDNYKTATFILREDYVPRAENYANFKKALRASRRGDDSQYQRMAASVAYGDYFEFMKSGFIQKATSALHDTFCKNGLRVFSGNGAQVFKVYGDDAMFGETSAAGVKHSGETANMSRDSIMSLATVGSDKGMTTASILDRLPNAVQVDIVNDKGSLVRQEKVSLEMWHNPQQGKPSLKDTCFTKIFPDMSWSLKQKFAPGVLGSELGQISRDEQVHGGQAF